MEGKDRIMADAANISFAIVTCSDTRSLAQDAAGDFLEGAIAECGWECRQKLCVLP